MKPALVGPMTDNAPFDALSALKERDRALYAACLYLPEVCREDIAVLHLYERETARIREMVSEPLPGEIRLQWWRDVLNGERDGEAAGHPLASSLLEVVKRYGLEPVLLERLADARIFDLYEDAMPTVEDFESYCGQTHSTILQCALRIIAPQEPTPSGDAAGHAGCAIGVAQVLENLWRHRRTGQMFIPADVLAATGATAENVLEAENALDAALDAFISLGESHLVRAQAALYRLPKHQRVALLPLAYASPVFSISRQRQHIILSKPPLIGPLKAQWSLLKMAIKL